jgi:hypothetical protein
MNRFATTALALAAAGSASYADPGDNEWLELDSEINSLASSLQPSQDGMGWTALIRVVYVHSSDEIDTGPPPTDQDTSGFNFKDVDIAFWGSVGDYGWRLSGDIEFNESGLVHDTDNDIGFEDAYVFWNCGEYVRTTLGQQKPMLIRSGYIDPENQLFIDRTAVGSSVDFWDLGVSADGTWEYLKWYAGILNSTNGHVRDHLWYGRVEWLMGLGAGLYEGAMGSTDELNLTVGGTYLNDDTFADANGDGDVDSGAWILDVHGNVSNFGFGAEMAGFDDDVIVGTDEDFGTVGLIFGDGTPWSVTGSYLINPEWEVGLRYEDLDNSDALALVPGSGADNTILSAVVNYYRTEKNVKWQAQWSDFEADSGFPDGSVFQIGVSVGASR